MMRTRPAPSSMTLAGLRSRWSTPRSCAAASPAQSCRAISAALSSGKRPMRRSERREVLAVHVLHREERSGRRLRRCRRRGRRSDARPAARSAPRCETARAAPDRRRSSVGQELERDWLAEPQIVGAVDLAHAAAPEQADNADIAPSSKSPGANRPWLIESDEVSQEPRRWRRILHGPAMTFAV